MNTPFPVDDMNASQAGLSPARPARAPPVARARGAMDRLAQLRAFQAERDKKRKAQQKTVKPPFRVGVYKLTQDSEYEMIDTLKANPSDTPKYP